MKGFEPTNEITIESPIGKLNVFDPDPIGIQAENNSLSFHEDGSVLSIVTSSIQITVIKEGVEWKTFSPKIVSSYCKEDALFISPP